MITEIKRLYDKVYREKNKEKIRVRVADWALKNKDRKKKTNSVWKKKNYNKFKNYQDNYRILNKEQIRVKNQKVYQKNKSKYSHRSLVKNYGITLEQYNQILLKQGSVCAICGGLNKNRRLCIDHDHKTGKVRGILCDNCNKGLGNFLDTPTLLLKAVKYLSTSVDKELTAQLK